MNPCKCFFVSYFHAIIFIRNNDTQHWCLFLAELQAPALLSFPVWFCINLHHISHGDGYHPLNFNNYIIVFCRCLGSEGFIPDASSEAMTCAVGAYYPAIPSALITTKLHPNPCIHHGKFSTGYQLMNIFLWASRWWPKKPDGCIMAVHCVVWGWCVGFSLQSATSPLSSHNRLTMIRDERWPRTTQVLQEP